MTNPIKREGATYICDCPGKPLDMLVHEGRVIVLTDVGVFEMLPGESFLRPVKFMTEQESAELSLHEQLLAARMLGDAKG